MKVLVLGTGGREYSIAKKISISSKVDKLYVAKGNGGTSLFAENVNIDPMNFEEIIEFAKDKEIDLTIVGPENPLCAGIVDEFEKENLKIFGPNKECAKFEGSKDFTKKFLIRNNIITATSKTFFDYESSIEYIKKLNFPTVIKADGLCFGKGVLIAKNFEESDEFLKEVFLDNSYNSDRVVIEEYLDGKEVSVICVVSNNKIFPLEIARDYKKIGENNTGLNTGGIGCICPVEDLTKIQREQIQCELDKISEGLIKENFNYNGILFVGFMLTEKANVLEFNVRFGDPETECILEKMESDLLEVINKSLDGTLKKEDIKYKDCHYTGVVLVSGGYPKEYKIGYEIDGLEKLDSSTSIIHCGTKVENGKLYTNGGRVLMLISEGKDAKEARDKVYSEMKKVNFKNAYYRRDIGI